MSGTEAEAVAALAQQAVRDLPMLTGAGWMDVPLPPGWDVHHVDQTRLLAQPARPAGTVVVHDAPSFIEVVARRSLGSTVVYADEDQLALVAVLNDDQQAEAGWRDYRAQLALRPTREWADWKAKNESLFEQEQFAFFVQRHVRDFREPTAADMLELAGNIEASKQGTFKAGQRLADGSRQFQWAETIEARAGKNGELQIPEKFAIAVRPFIGSDPWDVEAWLRYRIRDGHLVLSYELDRADLIEKEIFAEIVRQVDEETDTIIRGPAPAARA